MVQNTLYIVLSGAYVCDRYHLYPPGKKLTLRRMILIAAMIPNLYFVSKYTGYRFRWLEVVGKPLLCALIMGAAVSAIWHFGFGDPGHLNGFVLTAGILLCVGVGVGIYFFAALKIGAIQPENLPPKVRRLLKACIPSR